MPIISVIVPVYNVERYLEKCIDSIISQSFKDIEIILVNDGSTDSSGAICNKYRSIDNRIVVLNKTNGGLSSARNMGIEYCTGKFITFIDSDDTVSENILEKLYYNLINNNCDISVCNVIDIYDDGSMLKNEFNFHEVVSNQEAIRLELESRLTNGYAVAKLFKIELFDSIKFPKNKLYEDAFIILRLYAKTKKIFISTDQLYNYHRHNNTITTGNFKEKDFDCIKAHLCNYEFIISNYPSLEEQAYYRVIWSYLYILDKIILSNYEGRIKEEVISFINRNKNKIFKNNYLGYKRKLGVLIYLFSPYLYDKILRRCKK
ncbi:glycosyltransferase family 2 protein [[Clostridium] innocuum]|nr:glycosyltransferase family 2 protein [[Clostridium] innocuum]